MAAALVGGALLSASLQVLFDRLASPEVLNFFRAKRFNEKLLDQLKTTLYAADAVVDAAEYQQFTSPSVKRWLDDLRDAVYHANDLLEEISTKAAAQTQVTNIFSRALRGRKMGNKIAEIIERLESIMELKDHLGLDNKGREILGRLQSSWRPPTTSLPEEDVYGRNEAKDSVIKSLLGDKDDDSTLSVIPIVGMGGIGKTTLAQLVYNDDKVKEEFNLKAWVCVSDEFDILKITKAILQAVTNDNCNMEELDSIQLKLNESLSGKKFLIVLDDVWNEDYVKWDHLRKPFLHGAKGSKILLTTRSEQVALVVGTNPTNTYHVDKLSEEDSWLLFAKHAFHSMDGDGALRSSQEKIGGDIVKKCKGLPLAIKTLAGLMRSKNDIEDWNIILKSNLWDFSQNECNILPALAISYLYLPPHLKQCFAYCSLFPKDHEFDKEELIRLWMAEGFLQSTNKEMRMEEVGRMNFDALVSRSFFQPQTNFKRCFVMHDLMHDLSIFCAGEFCYRLEVRNAIEVPKRVRHLSYNSQDATIQDIEALCVMKVDSLRSIVVHSKIFWVINYKMKSEDVDRLLSKFKLLRVLFIVGCDDEVLPNSIGQLIFLRYLDLSFSYFKRLPASLCNLSNLQTLLLGGNRPPKGISKLKNLHFLPEFSLWHDVNIGELGGLGNINKLLHVRRLENIRSSKEASKAKMIDKKFIEELEFEWFFGCPDVMNDLETERDILGKLQPHSNLKVLEIRHYRGTRFPDWLGHPSYHNIVDIVVLGCKNCCILPPLGQLPSLKNLLIKKFDKLVNVGSEIYGTNYSPLTTPFPSLESLQISDMPRLQEWSSSEIQAFPNLRRVVFDECEELVRCCISAKQMVFVNCIKLEFPEQQRYDSLESLKIVDSCASLSSFPADTFSNLKELEISQYSGGDWFFGLWEVDGCFLKDGLLPPCLSSLSLEYIRGLKTFNLETFRHVTSLEHLNIQYCYGLEKSEVERLAGLATEIKIHYCWSTAPGVVEHLSNVECITFPDDYDTVTEAESIISVDEHHQDVDDLQVHEQH